MNRLTADLKSILELIASLSILFLACAIHVASESQQKEQVINSTNQNVSLINNKESIKVGNQKTNNYHFQESKYQPTQVTQFVVNVAKRPKLRKSRAPTIEELELKQRILDVFNAVRHDYLDGGGGDRVTTHLDHLEQILRALNPKYIATERVMRAAYADSYDHIQVIPPEAELPAPDESNHEPTDPMSMYNIHHLLGLAPVSINQVAMEPLNLVGDSRVPILDQLETFKNKFEGLFHWDKHFANELIKLDERQLALHQVAFKRLIQCLTYPLFCNKPSNAAGLVSVEDKLDGILADELNVGHKITPTIGQPVQGPAMKSEAPKTPVQQSAINNEVPMVNQPMHRGEQDWSQQEERVEAMLPPSPPLQQQQPQYEHHQGNQPNVRASPRQQQNEQRSHSPRGQQNSNPKPFEYFVGPQQVQEVSSGYGTGYRQRYVQPQQAPREQQQRQQQQQQQQQAIQYQPRYRQQQTRDQMAMRPQSRYWNGGLIHQQADESETPYQRPSPRFRNLRSRFVPPTSNYANQQLNN